MTEAISIDAALKTLEKQRRLVLFWGCYGLIMIEAWQKNSRYREVFRVCFPLVMSMSATTVMEFTDRIFLAQYSIDAISAVAPAGITAFLFIAFFGGIAGYASVFIAQYHGAGRIDKIGSALWQSLYFSLFSAVVFLFLSIFAAKPLFSFAGHPAEVQVLEEIYFNVLCRGAVFYVATHGLAAFFSGRGITRPVMVFNIIGMAVNIPLDYALIYGAWGLPEMGVYGAALATVTAWGIITLLLVVFAFTPKNISKYALLRNSGFDRELFLRLMKFGIPGSLQFTLDILAFTIFLLMVGRIGKLELAATNIVISINALAFMPSMGVSQGLSALVGQALGRKRPDHARYATWSSIHMLLAYILIIDMVFLFAPQQILSFFIAPGLTAAEHIAIMALSTSLLRIIAAYLFFDALYMIFSGVLKGAGDTRFVMYCVALASLVFMILPLYLGIEYFHFTVQQAWYCVLAFVSALFAIVSFRYRQGKWQKMLVIEKIPETR